MRHGNCGGLRRVGGCSRMWCGGGMSSRCLGRRLGLGFWFGGFCGTFELLVFHDIETTGFWRTYKDFT